MTLRELGLAGGMAITLLPVAAAYLRHRSGWAWGVTVLTAVAQVALLAATWKIVDLGADDGIRIWVYLLVAVAGPVLLTGYLFTLVLGRESPLDSLRNSSRTFTGLLVVSVVALVLLRRDGFVTGYQLRGGSGFILLGPLGKAYLSYLLVGAVFVGYNLENTYRLAAGAARERLRPVIIGLFGVLGFYTYVLTTGLLYSAIELDNVMASVVPLGIACVLTAYGFLRGSLADTTVPVSRTVMYTSFTAFAAALYVIAMGLAAQVGSFTRWSPGQVVTVSFVFLIILVAVVLLFSNRFQRRIRRFIDRNFYVNRYDYRTQWHRVTQALDPSHGSEGVLETAAALFQDVFLADRVTIGMRDRNHPSCRVVVGKGVGEAAAVIPHDSPLCRKLREERHALLLARQTDDMEYVPIYVENREWLDLTASQVVAPLLADQELLGVVGLERGHPDDRFSYEDLDLLECMAAEVAAVVRAVELAQELSEAKEMELLSQWSSMILHDLKNYLSPLRLIVQNMRIHRENPEFQREAVEDLSAVTERMEDLVKRLSELREGPRFTEGVVDMNELVQHGLAELQLTRRPNLRVETALGATEGVRGDAAMLRRVVENIITNAVEAMRGVGTLRVRTETPEGGGNGSPGFILTVSDDGPGIPAEFIERRLFRPFATTKKSGLGLGLYQCRSIVESHGGEIQVESRVGVGTTFRVLLRGAAPAVPKATRAVAGLSRLREGGDH